MVLKNSVQKKKLLWEWVYSFPKRQILDSSELKEIADNNFKLDEND